MMTGSTATIVSVGKPLPESLVGQQVEIVRFVSPSFPAVRTADGREYIMDISHLDCSVKAISLSKQWIEAGIRHRKRYARWLRGMHGAYLILKQHPEHLESLIRESDRLLIEATQFQVRLEVEF